jgi:NADH-quinone oxidoreductase subunit K
MSPLTLEGYLVVGAVLFVLGMIGFLSRRNMILMFLSAETMLQGVALNLVAFAKFRGNLSGQVLTLFVLTVAACEAAVALAMIVMLFRSKKTLDVSLWQDLREPGQEAIVDADPAPAPQAPAGDPKLVPAGAEPPTKKPREMSHV